VRAVRLLLAVGWSKKYTELKSRGVVIKKTIGPCCKVWGTTDGGLGKSKNCGRCKQKEKKRGNANIKSGVQITFWVGSRVSQVRMGVTTVLVHLEVT